VPGLEAGIQAAAKEAAMTCAYSQVLIFCPENPTGGPEALHQLSYMIRHHGGSSGMVYTWPNSHAIFDKDRLHLFCHLSPKTTIHHHFSAYRPVVATQSRLDNKTILIFPEIDAEAARSLDWVTSELGVRRAIWWLSVDLGLTKNPGFANRSYREEFFSDPSIMHFYQSAYAREFLRTNNARCYYPLFDFTDQDIVDQSQLRSDFVDTEKRSNLICTYPQKGGHLAEQFARSADWASLGVQFSPIQNMSKAEVRHTLFKSKIYIDFGHNPGKDRLPREAAIAGSIILLLGVGSAKMFEDHPLDPYYIFDEPDILSGHLSDKVMDVIKNSKTHYENQRLYRQRVLLEREQFSYQTRALFFDGVRDTTWPDC
jgi:hypothetical protein